MGALICALFFTIEKVEIAVRLFCIYASRKMFHVEQ